MRLLFLIHNVAVTVLAGAGIAAVRAAGLCARRSIVTTAGAVAGIPTTWYVTPQMRHL